MTPEIAGPIWKENVKIADANNRPGKFTAFCSYEWTSQFDNRNLHRNIFFRDCAKVPEMPFSALWTRGIRRTSGSGWIASAKLATSCSPFRTTPTSATAGCILPMSTASDGRSTLRGPSRAIATNALIEIKQIKGQSETHPLLSPNDEFANYEIISCLLGLPPDSGRIDTFTEATHARR